MGSKLYIVSPAYTDGFSSAYITSLLDTFGRFEEKKIPVKWGAVTHCAFVTQARDVCCSLFLKTDYTHLLMVDSDMSWPGAGILRAFNHNRPVVALPCPGRHALTQRWNFAFTADKKQPEPNGLIEVDRVGTGVMLIQRKVLEKLAKTARTYKGEVEGKPTNLHEFFPTLIKGGEFIGEDVAFCQKVREIGYPIFVDLSVQVGHAGGTIYRGDMEALMDAVIKETA